MICLKRRHFSFDFPAYRRWHCQNDPHVDPRKRLKTQYSAARPNFDETLQTEHVHMCMASSSSEICELHFQVPKPLLSCKRTAKMHKKFYVFFFVVFFKRWRVNSPWNWRSVAVYWLSNYHKWWHTEGKRHLKSQLW